MPELDLLMHALQPLLRRNQSALGNLVSGPDGHLNSLMHATVVALLANAGASADKSESAKLLRYLLSGWDDLDLHALHITTPVGVGRSWSRDEAIAAIASTTQVTTGVNVGSNLILTHWPGVMQEEKSSSLGAIQLYLALVAAQYLAEISGEQVTPRLQGLGSIEESYASIDPAELAESDPDFIARVYQVTNEFNLSEWASIKGLITLALLPDDKLRKISGKDFEFVISNSSTGHARSTLLSGIINRYNARPETESDTST